MHHESKQRRQKAWDGRVAPIVKMTPDGGLKVVLNVPRHENNAIQLKNAT